MDANKVFSLNFAKIYQLYLQKVEKKGRTAEELDTVILWLTGYDEKGLREQLEQDADLKTFIDHAPQMNPNCSAIRGKVCGVRVEDIEDPMMGKIRYMDKLVDELAKGRPMKRILRNDDK